MYIGIYIYILIYYDILISKMDARMVAALQVAPPLPPPLQPPPAPPLPPPKRNPAPPEELPWDAELMVELEEALWGRVWLIQKWGHNGTGPPNEIAKLVVYNFNNSGL